ncbi:MAG: hypothetical protein LBN10_02335 [Propionibacteriaceae bacterium]|nr:hypothetical protein [Propionibacteriaceae bacterium]
MTTLTFQRQPVANLGALLRFMARYNWVRLVLWFLLTAGMLAFIAVYYRSLNEDDPNFRASLESVSAVPSMMAMAGILSNFTPLGSAVWIKAWMFIAVMLGIGMVFLVTHNLRADEDAGRTEVFRSRPLGIHSSYVATLIMTVGVCVISGVGCAVVLNALGLVDTDSKGCWVFGLSIMAVGFLGVGLGLLANQLAASSSGANGIGIGIFIVAYLFRMAADMQATHDPVSGTIDDTALIWVNPLGWAERMDPWGQNRLWPVFALFGLMVVCAGIGWVIETRRDYGGSLLAVRPGNPDAGPLMTSVWGLTLRLQRVSFFVWALAVAVFALMFGTVVHQFTDFLDAMPAGMYTGIEPLKAVGALFVCMLALCIGAFVIQSSQNLIIDDTHGLLEYQLSGAVSRLGWAAQRLGVTCAWALVLLAIAGACFAGSFVATTGDNTQFVPLFAALFAYVPSLLFLMSVVVLGLGWWPRAGIAVGWAVFAVFWFLMLLGETLSLPTAVFNWLPFISTSSVPANPVDWTKIAVTGLVSLSMIGLGLLGFRRRNIPA